MAKRVAILLMVVLAVLMTLSVHRIRVVLAAGAQNNYVSAFPLTENPISEGGSWVNGGAAGNNCFSPTSGICWGNIQTGSGHIFGTIQNNGCGGSLGQNCNDSTAVLSGTWTTDQAACVTVAIDPTLNRSSGTEEVEIRLRTTISAASITGYEYNYSMFNNGNQYMQIVRWNGPIGQFTPLPVTATNPLPAMATGDIFCASAIGSSLRSFVYRAGVLIAQTNTVTDATYAGGSPGVGFFNGAGPLSDMPKFAFSKFEAANLVAFSANQTDVNSVINGPLHTATCPAVNNCESILIPPGNVTWTSTSVSISAGNSVFGYGVPNTAAGQFGASADCASEVVITTAGSSVWKFVPASYNANLYRVSCMAINYQGPSASIAVSAGGVCNTTTCTNMRMDNISFGNWANHTAIVSFGINVIGDFFGVLDHNTIIGNGIAGSQFLQLVELNHASFPNPNPTPNGNLYGDSSWNQPEGFGSANFMYIENNSFSNSGCCENEGNFGGLTHQGGGRVIARFNTYTIIDSANFGVGWHGTESSGRPRSGRATEFYGNSMNYPQTCNPVNSGNCPPLAALRGGDALIWGNTISATSPNFGGGIVGLNFLRAGGSTGGWPACDGTVTEDGNDPAANLSTPAFSGTLASVVGTGYTSATGVTAPNISGAGSGLTVNTTAVGGVIQSVAINAAGTNYGVGAFVKISGGNGDAALEITSVSSGAVTGVALAFFQNVVIASTTSGTAPPWGANIWSPAGAPYSLHDVNLSTSKQLAIGAEIQGNGSNTITVWNGSFFTPYVAGDQVLITRAFWCMDQSTRGAGVMQNSSQTLPTVPPFVFSNEVLMPSYIWMQTFTNAVVGGGQNGVGSDTLRVIRNRDYYTENTGQTAQSSPTSPFNGTTATGGIGHGTLANRPACVSPTCPANVAYFATDQGNWNSGGNPNYTGQGELFVWNGSAWVLTYTPFQYPHPLITGGIQAVTVTPPSENFGSVVVGASSGTQTATLSNTTASSITITSVTQTGNTADFPNVTPPPICSGTIAANGGTCVVTSKFSPTSTGARSATLTIATSVGSFPVALTGTGTSAVNPGISIAPASIAFGNVSVGTSTPGTTVTATSTTSANLVMSNPPATISGTGFSLQAIGGQCTANQSIPQSSTCVESVVFTPAAPGAVSGSLSFFDNVTGSPQVVPLTGTGVGTIAVNPVSLNFGTIAQGQTSPAQPVVITNNTGITLTLTGTTFTNLDFAPTSNNCNSGTLTNGQSCTATITARPSATTGTNETGFMLVNFTGVGGSPVSVPLAVTVLPPIGTPATNIFAKNLAGCGPIPRLTTFCFTQVGSIYVAVCNPTCTAFKPLTMQVTGVAQ